MISLNSDDKVALIQKWACWFYDRTETWEGDLGMELAYLFKSIADGQCCEWSLGDEIVKMLKDEQIPDSDPIWEYIFILEKD